ncbi:MAG: AAA family ATPase, partial [Myxococcaceae bacterium]|nr:AAA family ATPase [Myxococcaceae bacterium]
MTARLIRRVSGPVFGRDAELGVLAQLLDGPDRLVVLVGPAGVGKTRLAWAALQRTPAARQRLWVDATVAADARGLVAAIARALDVTPGIVEPLVLLAETAEALDRSAAVLVIDELEHLGAAGAAAVASLSDAAPSAAVWCTSRERLDAGERVLEVRPLAIDDASALFTDAFARAAPSRRLEAATAREIAALTDGLPLALELAATRAAAVGPSEVLTDLKSAPGRALALGHVYDAIARTLKRMPPDLRSAFAAASVFDGGFDTSAARAVLPLPTGYQPLDVLQALSDASLLVSYDAGPTARFGMLTVVRAYAAELLAKEPALDARTRLLHVRHYATLASTAESPEGWAQLQLERGNLRAAWAHGVGVEPTSAALVAVAFERVLLTQGPADAHE